MRCCMKWRRIKDVSPSHPLRCRRRRHRFACRNEAGNESEKLRLTHPIETDSHPPTKKYTRSSKKHLFSRRLFVLNA